MKSKDTLKWFPSQLPKVRIILGDAVVEVAKQGRPINTRTLLDYIEGNIKTKAPKHGWITKNYYKQQYQFLKKTRI